MRVLALQKQMVKAVFVVLRQPCMARLGSFVRGFAVSAIVVIKWEDAYLVVTQQGHAWSLQVYKSIGGWRGKACNGSIGPI